MGKKPGLGIEYSGKFDGDPDAVPSTEPASMAKTPASERVVLKPRTPQSTAPAPQQSAVHPSDSRNETAQTQASDVTKQERAMWQHRQREQRGAGVYVGTAGPALEQVQDKDTVASFERRAQGKGKGFTQLSAQSGKPLVVEDVREQVPLVNSASKVTIAPKSGGSGLFGRGTRDKAAAAADAMSRIGAVASTPPKSSPTPQPTPAVIEQPTAPEPTTPPAEITPPPPPAASPEAAETVTSFPQVEPQEDLAVYLDQLADALEANGDARLDVDGRPQISFAKVAKKLRLLHDELAVVKKNIERQDAYELRMLATRITNLPVPEDVGKHIAKQLGLAYSRPDSVRADMRVENTAAPVELKPMESKVPTSLPAPDEVAPPQPFTQQEGLSLDALRERAEQQVEAPGAVAPPEQISPEVMQQMQVEEQPGAVAPIQVATAQEGAKPAETVNTSPETSQLGMPQSSEATSDAVPVVKEGIISYKDMYRQSRDMYKTVASAREELQQAIEAYHAAKNEAGFMKFAFKGVLSGSDEKRKVDEARANYEQVLDTYQQSHDAMREQRERVAHEIASGSAAEGGVEKRRHTAYHIALRETVLKKRLAAAAVEIENVRLLSQNGKDGDYESSWRLVRMYQAYRKLPIHYKVGVGVMAAAGVGGIMGLTGLAAGASAGSMALAMGGRRLVGGTVGMGAAIGTKLGLDALIDRKKGRELSNADAHFGAGPTFSQSLRERVDIERKARKLKIGATGAAALAAVATGAKARDVIDIPDITDVQALDGSRTPPVDEGSVAQKGVVSAAVEDPLRQEPVAADEGAAWQPQGGVGQELAPAAAKPENLKAASDAVPVHGQQPAGAGVAESALTQTGVAEQQLAAETAAEQPDSAAPEPQPAPEPAPAPQAEQQTPPEAADLAEEPEKAPQTAPAPEPAAAPQSDPQAPQPDTETSATGTSEAAAEQAVEVPAAAQDQLSAESAEEPPVTVAEVAEANNAAVATLSHELQQQDHLSWRPVRDMIANDLLTPEEHALIRDNWNWFAHVDITAFDPETPGTVITHIEDSEATLTVPPDARAVLEKVVNQLVEKDITLKDSIVRAEESGSPMPMHAVLQTHESHDVSDFNTVFAELDDRLGQQPLGAAGAGEGALAEAHLTGELPPESLVDDVDADALKGAPSGKHEAGVPEEPLPGALTPDAAPSAPVAAESLTSIDLASVVEKPEAFNAKESWSIGGTYEAGDSVQGELQVLLKGEFGVSESDAGAIAHNLQERLAQEGGAYAEAFGVEGGDWNSVQVGTEYGAKIPRELVQEVVTETLANKIDIPSAQLDVEIKPGDNLTKILDSFAQEQGVPDANVAEAREVLLNELRSNPEKYTGHGFNGNVDDIQAGDRLQLTFSNEVLAKAGIAAQTEAEIPPAQGPAPEAPATPSAAPATPEAPEPATPPSEGGPSDVSADNADTAPPATDPEQLTAVAEAAKQQLPEGLTAQPGDPGYVEVEGMDLGEKAEQPAPETSGVQSESETAATVREGQSVTTPATDPEQLSRVTEEMKQSFPEELVAKPGDPEYVEVEQVALDGGAGTSEPVAKDVPEQPEPQESGDVDAAELQQQLADTDEALQSAQKAIDAANAATGNGQDVSAPQAPAGGESALDALAAQQGVKEVTPGSGEGADASSAGAADVSAEVPASSSESQQLESPVEAERPLPGMQPRLDSFPSEQVNTYLETLGKADMQVENELPNRFEPVIERTGKQFEDVLKDEVFNTVNAEQRKALADVWEALAFMPIDQLLDETDGLTYKVPTGAGTDISFTLDANTEKFVAEVVRGAAQALAGEDGDPQALLTDAVGKNLQLYKLFEK